MTTQLSEVRGEPLPVDLPSLWEQYCKNVTLYPKSIALICTHQAPDLYAFPSIPLNNAQSHQNAYLRWTYETLKTAVDRVVVSLRLHGIEEGSPVVTFLQNNAEWLVIFLAANCIGCIIAPINPRNLTNRAEVSHMLNTVVLASSNKPLVFIAGSVEIATQIDSLNISRGTPKFGVFSDPSNGWAPFESLISKPVGSKSIANLSLESAEGASARLVLFTSGTTSLPKGCMWTADAFGSFIVVREGLIDAIQPDDKCCIVVPNNHALGCAFLGFSLFYGAAIVYPGPAFVPGAMMSGLRDEQCTHTAMVPTMIHALTAVSAPGQPLLKLKSITLGGSMVTPEALYTCMNKIGTAGVENGYGMTEGLLITTGNHRHPSKIINGGKVSVGWVKKGTAAKICAAGGTTPLARNTPGELHFSGRSLSKGYIGRESENFYTDEQGVAWLITGDQGVMDDQDRIYVVGRYKG
jgi:acyl-CoA synthetase (AMP-forming)/AMP-acid ligase II